MTMWWLHFKNCSSIYHKGVLEASYSFSALLLKGISVKIFLGFVVYLYMTVHGTKCQPCSYSLTAVVGLLYPCIDSHLGEPHKFKREWASVMRCIAVFVGINHASAVSLK